MLLLHLLISVVVMVIVITILRMDASIGLVSGAIYLGVAAGIPLPDTINTIGSGFGGLMTAIGLPIAFGVMIGKLLADIGGVEAIAKGFTSKIRKKENTPYALLATGLIASTPVYYDVVYVIVAPLTRGLSRLTKYPLCYYLGALVAGAGIAHCFILPTPGPLAGASILGIPLGVMFVMGILVGIPSALLTYWVYKQIVDRVPNYWNPEKDVDVPLSEDVSTGEEEKARNMPGFGLAILPIVIPIVLILSGTLVQALTGSTPPFIQFISHRIFAMMMGAVVTFIIAWKKIGQKKANKSLQESLSMVGVILLVTGAGGSFGAVISATGVSNMLADVMQGWSISPILFVWIVASIIGGAQGSGTVGMITAASLIAPSVNSLGVSPIYLATAAFGGAMAFRWLNDSGFWVSTLVAKLKISGGFKTYSAVCLIMSIISLVITLLFSVIWPAPFGI